MGNLARVVACIGLGLFIYRLLLFLMAVFLGNLFSTFGLIFEIIIKNVLLPFFIGILIAFLINSRKDLGWLYAVAFILTDYFIIRVIQDIYFVDYSFWESFKMMAFGFLYGGIFSAFSAAAGGKYGDFLRKREDIKA